MDSETSPRAPPVERRILIIDGHALVRRGLSALIDGEPDLAVCAVAATRREGRAAVAAAGPDLVIVEIALAGGDGLALVDDIRSGRNAPPVLVFSLHDAPRHVRRALKAGAGGYVGKQETGETLLAAIRALLGGATFVGPKVGRGLDSL